MSFYFENKSTGDLPSTVAGALEAWVCGCFALRRSTTRRMPPSSLYMLLARSNLSAWNIWHAVMDAWGRLAPSHPRAYHLGLGAVRGTLAGHPISFACTQRQQQPQQIVHHFWYPVWLSQSDVSSRISTYRLTHHAHVACT